MFWNKDNLPRFVTSKAATKFQYFEGLSNGALRNGKWCWFLLFEGYWGISNEK